MAVGASEINNYMGYTTQAKPPSQNMDKEAFMKLLVAQLQNQDPTEQGNDPMAMVQQMTSFSQLEQLENLAGLLQGMQDQNIALFQSNATNLVGKTVRVQGAGVELKNGKASVGLDLPGPAAKVTMVIKDENGKTVASIEKGGLKAGHHDITWDGKTEAEAQLKDGTYYIEFQAASEDGQRLSAVTVVDLKVDSVAFAEGTVMIVAGGKYYSLGDIIEVRPGAANGCSCASGGMPGFSWKADSSFGFETNLDADAQLGTSYYKTSLQLCDDKAGTQQVTVEYEKIGENEWIFQVTAVGGATLAEGAIQFGDDGQIAAIATKSPQDANGNIILNTTWDNPPRSVPITWKLNAGTAAAPKWLITQHAAPSTTNESFTDGGYGLWE